MSEPFSFSAPASIVAKYGMSPRRLQELVKQGVLAVEDGRLVEVEQKQKDEDKDD